MSVLPLFDPHIRRDMPLVDWVVDNWGKACPFAEWNVLFIQHQLENHLAQAEAMFECGMENQRFFWLDIPYTSSAAIRDALQKKYAINGEQFDVHDYDLTLNYSSYQRARVVRWIRKYLDEYGMEQPLLVVDDGGYFLEALVCLKQHPRKLAVVEQTTRGINKINSNPAIHYYFSHIPVVDVATSPAKKNLESPYIARAVCESIAEKLEVLLEKESMVLNGSNILILGYGDIGSSVAGEVQEHFGVIPGRIYVYDTDHLKCERARQRGYHVWQQQVNSVLFSLVIGCTGKTSFDIWDYVHLENNAILISASSGSAEMARESFVELADSSDIDDITVIDRKNLAKQDIHYDIHLNLVSHNVIIANGGFPVNFDGRLNRIPAKHIQLTIALMIYGAIQAVTSYKDNQQGLLPLDRDFCHKLREKYLALTS